jgi:hypothetical protein
MRTNSPKNGLTNRNRIESIDVLRGLVMVIMALDHVRHLFHSTAFTENPLDLTTSTPELFLTRWITHFCAPIFVFLSGTSIYLQSLRKTKAELSAFLIKRGLWLVFAEVTIVTLGITFNPFYGAIILQVIWAIGISMVILGLLIHLPFRLILALGLAIVLGHNLLDSPEAVPGFKTRFWLGSAALPHPVPLLGRSPANLRLPVYALAGVDGCWLLRRGIFRIHRLSGPTATVFNQHRSGIDRLLYPSAVQQLVRRPGDLESPKERTVHAAFVPQRAEIPALPTFYGYDHRHGTAPAGLDRACPKPFYTVPAHLWPDSIFLLPHALVPDSYALPDRLPDARPCVSRYLENTKEHPVHNSRRGFQPARRVPDLGAGHPDAVSPLPLV